MASRFDRRSALAAGTAALVLGPAATAGALDREKGSDEPGALTALLTAELHAAFAYERFQPRIARQESDHAKALASLLAALGWPIPTAPMSAAQLQPSARALAESPGRSAAIALERALIEGCTRQIGKLGDPGMVRTVATIMASHAQHLLLGERSADSQR